MTNPLDDHNKALLTALEEAAQRAEERKRAAIERLTAQLTPADDRLRVVTDERERGK